MPRVLTAFTMHDMEQLLYSSAEFKRGKDKKKRKSRGMGLAAKIGLGAAGAAGAAGLGYLAYKNRSAIGDNFRNAKRGMYEKMGRGRNPVAANSSVIPGPATGGQPRGGYRLGGASDSRPMLPGQGGTSGRGPITETYRGGRPSQPGDGRPSLKALPGRGQSTATPGLGREVGESVRKGAKRSTYRGGKKVGRSKNM